MLLSVVQLLGCAPSKLKTHFFQKLYVRMKHDTASHRNPGKSSYPLPRGKKTLSARHASYSARIDLKPRPQVPAGIPVSTYYAFRLKVRVQRCTIENRRKIHNTRIHMIVAVAAAAAAVRMTSIRSSKAAAILQATQYRTLKATTSTAFQKLDRILVGSGPSRSGAGRGAYARHA